MTPPLSRKANPMSKDDVTQVVSRAMSEVAAARALVSQAAVGPIARPTITALCKCVDSLLARLATPATAQTAESGEAAPPPKSASTDRAGEAELARAMWMVAEDCEVLRESSARTPAQLWDHPEGAWVAHMRFTRATYLAKAHKILAALRPTASAPAQDETVARLERIMLPIVLQSKRENWNGNRTVEALRTALSSDQEGQS